MWQRLGQHFLHDQMVVEQIAEEIFELQQKLGATTCLEIWPGKAVLTSHLIDRFRQLFLLEIDEGLRAHLCPFEKRWKARILWWDVLKHTLTVVDTEKGSVKLDDLSEQGMDGEPLQGTSDTPTAANSVENSSKTAFERQDLVFQPSKTLVVGNLPYYITSPILRKFFVEPLSESGIGRWFSGGVFLVQKELAEKIATVAKKKSYLRRLLNCNYQIDYCFTVGAWFFTPPPKVNSAVIKLFHIPPKLTPEKFTKLLRLLDVVSPYKRKTLGKIMKIEQASLTQLWATFPEELLWKRLEEVTRDEMKVIIGS